MTHRKPFRPFWMSFAMLLVSLMMTGCMAHAAHPDTGETTYSSDSMSTISTTSASSSHSSFTLDLNGDGREDYCETTSSSHNGRVSGKSTCYVALGGGHFRKVFELPYPVTSFSVPGTRTNGWLDLVTQQAASSQTRIWRWNGHQYRSS